ncbi:alpha-amylase family glycosyl hydrolase [Clavibacter michiganensis subsp. phaseoli]|uniref:glycogen debranching protein n=1 Tax=Clavibacter phaseoli TaxID=1734031 RepID=UPI001FB30A20|nr:alpha-amylase family glycosyl hydrolase [Clavibacter phaseoli]MCJ1710845.1 alpha-amylase family glycosyl hydrolase [Clavibacter phaseoli]
MPRPGPPVPLGLTLHDQGGTLRMVSHGASAVELTVSDVDDPRRVVEVVAMERGDAGVWTGSSARLVPGTAYSVRVDGDPAPGDSFDATRHLLDPYARGLVQVGPAAWRSVVTSEVPAEERAARRAARPVVPRDRQVVYELHVRGFTKTDERLPEELRGTYAGLGHATTVERLVDLGITTVELLPVHASTSEERLRAQGRINHWGYNTLAYLAPHAPYATRRARDAGADGVAAEFRAMVDALHAAGIQVVLDVVYNHTAEEGADGPITSLRGIDGSRYYRHTPDGTPIDVTGCGNTVDLSRPDAQRLVLDSLEHWSDVMGVDGFRFDLAVTLGRDERVDFDPAHPLLRAIVEDEALDGLLMIAEPWDVGMGGWRTGGFGSGWSEWNDGYRDRVRDFWLADVAEARRSGRAPNGVGALASCLAGSSGTFAADRGPLASVSFVTAHDGFTLADLTSYDRKHNSGNGESNRDGTDANRSWNHGVEGPTRDAAILAARRRTSRNLLGTLLVSAGIPMITMGDERGRTQRGNNNGYCLDNAATWMRWDEDAWRMDLEATTRHLLRIRRENPALRPVRYAEPDARVPSASVLAWRDADGAPMTEAAWESPGTRTLQWITTSTPETEEPSCVLVVVHGQESRASVTLPEQDCVTAWRLLWSSEWERPEVVTASDAPGDRVEVDGPALRIYRAG